MKKGSLSESSSDLVELEEGLLVTRDQLARKQNCNPRHNNNINAMSIETDVWLRGKHYLYVYAKYLRFFCWCLEVTANSVLNFKMWTIRLYSP